MSKKEHHVVPNISGWSVKRENSTRASVNTETKAEAIKIGRIISQRQGSELIVHGKDDKIQTSDNHGKVSFPPKDKK